MDIYQKNSGTLPLLKANPDKIDWYWLSKNPSAMDLIESNLDKIFWPWLCENLKFDFFIFYKTHQ
jgi:hypothetical protein